MNRTVRAFVVTPLLFICMIAAPAIALSADGYLSVSLFQSPVPPDASANQAGAPVSEQPPATNAESNSAASSAAEPTNAAVTETAQPVTPEQQMNEEPAHAPQINESSEGGVNGGEAGLEEQGGAAGVEPEAVPLQEGEELETEPATGEISVTTPVTATDSGDTGDIPATDTPAAPVMNGPGTMPSTTNPVVGNGNLSPLPSPTATPVSISPLPSPSATPVNNSPLPTPTSTSTATNTPTPTATATRVNPPQPPKPTSRPPQATVAATPIPVITVQPTTVVLAPADATATSLYPTPMREIPTPTPEVPASALRLDGYWVQKVIGDRFSSVIYAYANEWLYRSETNGATWTLVTSIPAVQNFIMNADNPNVLFSGHENSCAEGAPNGPMLKSVNGGLSWFELPNSSGLRPLLSHPFKPEILVAADCQWLYVSEDGGASWSPRPDLTAEALWQSYTIVSAAAVYTEDAESPDDLAWQRLYVGAQAADGSGIVAYTEDLGLSWQQITPDVSPAPWGMSTIALDLFNPNRSWFADNNGVWYTPDGGVDWRFAYQGLNVEEQEGAGELVFMVIHPTGQIYLGTERGLYTKVLDGASWTKVANTSFDQTRINGILFTETNANLLYLNTSDGVHLVKIEG